MRSTDSTQLIQCMISHLLFLECVCPVRVAGIMEGDARRKQDGEIWLLLVKRSKEMVEVLKQMCSWLDRWREKMVVEQEGKESWH